MIEVRLERVFYLTRRHCYLCGGSTNKDAVLPFVYDDGERLAAVCDDCVRQESTDALRARMTHFIEHLRADADHLEQLAATLPALPSLESLRQARHDCEVDDEIAREGVTRAEAERRVTEWEQSGGFF